MKKCKAQSAKCKIIFSAIFFSLFLFCSSQNLVAQSNKIGEIPNGGYVREWLISNQFPSEIDAGTWENFNRFNIEKLPVRDWLAPFGGASQIKPVEGVLKAAANSDPQNPKSQISNPQSSALLPEDGATTSAKTFADAREIAWRKISVENPSFEFYTIFGGKNVGTAYVAANLFSVENTNEFIETDGFAGEIWLNGVKIYDGFSLNIQKIVRADFRKGNNLILVRASGVSGDYWRKNGGWSATIKLWKDEASAQKSAQYKASGASGTINYLEGFHVDPVYLHDQRGYARITLSNTAQYLRNLRSDPRYGVYLSEIDYLKPYLDTNPQDREFLREAVKGGRVGAGGAYNQFNENTIGGEAIIRNILYGQTMHNQLLGKKSESLALWDVFGHSPQISQIARKSGFTGLVWSKKIQGFEPFFYDYALDGSRLLHRRVDYAYSFSGFGSGKNYSLDNFRRMTERKYEEARSYNSATDLRINAADFTPPWTNLAGNVETLESQKPKIRVSGQAQDFYFRELNKEIADGKVQPPVTSRDKLFFHVGVSMARSDLKIGQRISENATLTAEKFGTIAYLLGAKYPDLALDKAWRQIFFGSHHDAITGTPSDSAFLDLVHGYREAFELSQNALDDSLKFIAKRINTNRKSQIACPKSPAPLVIFNPSNWTRTDVVNTTIDFAESDFGYELIDEKGAIVKFKLVEPPIGEKRNVSSARQIEFIAENVPSIGYKTYYFKPNKFAQMQFGGLYSIGDFQLIENEFYSISINTKKGGAIAKIYDKEANREIISTADGHLANEIGVLTEELTKKNVIYPAWELWTTGARKFSTASVAKIVLHPLASDGRVITIEGELPNMRKYRQTIALHKGVKRIDFKTELIDYKGKNELFIVNFPLNLTGGALVTEDRFGTVVRNSSKGFLDFRTNTDKLVSGAPVYSANNWAEYGSTFNLNFVDSNNLIAASVPFKPTALVRPHGEAYGKLTETIISNLIKRGVSVTPFYDDNDAPRRAKLTIEDSTMPKNLNDDVAYHNFRISLGGEKENAYSSKLLKQITAETRAKFAARLQKDGCAFLFLYDSEIPKDYPKMPTLLIAANSAELYEKAVERLVISIRQNSSATQPSEPEASRLKRDYNYGKLDAFAVDLPFESFAVETNPGKELTKVPDYGVALINHGTAGISLEKNNVLTLFLTHTADFPGVNLPFEFTPEHKSHVYEYSLYPHFKNWREAEAVKTGYDANNPLIAVQTGIHDGDLPSEKSFYRVQASNLVISALKLGENPQASFYSKGENESLKYPVLNLRESRLRPVILRAYETAGVNAYSSMFSDAKIAFGSETGMLENSETVGAGFSGNSVNSAQPFDSFEIKTFQLYSQRKSSENDQLGQTKELIQPVFSRYWQHNSGAAPIGNDAVKVSIRPLEQQGELSTFAYDDKYNQGGTTTVGVRVSVVNNYQDRKISGEVKLDVPEDWRVVPATLKYDIEPNGSYTQDAAVVTFPVKKGTEWERASGLVKAVINHDGQTFQDVLNLGKTLKLEWKSEQTPSETIIKIVNPHRQTIEGAVALITPPEAWFFNKPAFPREIGFAIEPNSETILRFKTGDLSFGTWRIARLAYNGNVEYLDTIKK